jgi:hypothetical protein
VFLSWNIFGCSSSLSPVGTLHRSCQGSLSLHSPYLLCTWRDLPKIFARTLHLFKGSPQALQRRSFSPTPPSSPSLNASRTGSPLGAHSRSVSADFDRFKMAFNSFGASNPAGGSAPAELGPELSEVYTDVGRPAKASASFDTLVTNIFFSKLASRAFLATPISASSPPRGLAMRFLPRPVPS